MMETTKGSKFLKVTGILMIIFGGLAIITSGLTAATTGFINSLFDGTGIDGGSLIGLLNTMIYIAIAGGIIQLVTGILGVAFCKKPEKASICLVAGIIVLAMGIISAAIIPLIGQSDPLVIEFGLESAFGVNWIGLFCSAVLPVLFIIGAMKNKQS